MLSGTKQKETQRPNYSLKVYALINFISFSGFIVLYSIICFYNCLSHYIVSFPRLENLSCQLYLPLFSTVFIWYIIILKNKNMIKFSPTRSIQDPLWLDLQPYLRLFTSSFSLTKTEYTIHFSVFAHTVFSVSNTLVFFLSGYSHLSPGLRLGKENNENTEPILGPRRGHPYVFVNAVNCKWKRLWKDVIYNFMPINLIK